MGLKDAAKAALRRFGYELHRVSARAAHASHQLGRDPVADLRQLASETERPLIFDVGANVGQTALKFREHFRAPVIHAFEPGPEPFAKLRELAGRVPDLQINNVALGARTGVMPYFENTAGSEMNSLLEPRPEGWGGGHVSGRREVPMATLDEYCEKHGISRIDILKTDTQGYDFEVIKGAAGLIARKAVQLIYMEILFSDMYKGQARLDQIYGWLADRGFVLVSFYPFFYWGNKASWTEAVFIHPEFAP